MANLKNLTFSIIFSLLLFKLVASDGTSSAALIGSCTSNDVVDNNYQNTLQTLLSNLTSTSASTSLTFYYSNSGESPNKAYGLYLCRGDVPLNTCRTCVKSITDTFMLTKDNNCNEAFTYTADTNCMIHYSNSSFFGGSNNQGPVTFGAIATTTSYDEAYSQTLGVVLKGVITDAAQSRGFFATREAGVVQGTKVYSLAQCTPDLDSAKCSECLNSALEAVSALSDIRAGKAGSVKSAQGLLPSCQLKYSDVSFYGGGEQGLATSNAPAAVSALLVAAWCLFLIRLLLS